jgi:hypothetical protein
VQGRTPRAPRTRRRWCLHHEALFFLFRFRLEKQLLRHQNTVIPFKII